MRRTLLSGLAVLLLAFITAESAPVLGSKDKVLKPKLKLQVSAHHGITPLSVTLKGTIENLDPKKKSECRIRIDWVNDTGDGFAFRTREEISCVRGGDVKLAPPRFERKHKIDKAGKYTYRIMLKPEEGNQLASATREIKVFQSGHELSFGVGVSGEVN